MHSKLFLCTAAVALGVAFAAQSASADVSPTLDNCVKLGHDLRTALDAHPDSPNLGSAKKEGMSGRSFCEEGDYEKGVSHYQHALQLITDPQPGQKS